MSRHALLIGVSAPGLNVSLGQQRLAPVLERLGFDRIERVLDDRATRAGILERLDALGRAAQPGDAVLIHYFGHGGRVRFPDLPEPWGSHVFGYVTCHREGRGGRWTAVLDHELSSRLTAIDARCGNVTVIFDCCYSGELVRDPTMEAADHRVEAVADWVEQAVTKPDVELALESHPRIVRLCGASPKREAFAATRSGRQIGRLTEALIAALSEAGEDWPQLCWATLGHRVREHVIGALQMEGQWVNLAGPRSRRLWSTETVTMPGTVAYVPGDDEGRGWIRAGWLQGVRVGDRWSVLDPRVGPGGRPRPVATGLVESVGRNRAELSLCEAPQVELRPGSPACPQRVAAPMGVIVPESMRDAVQASAWLEGMDAEPAEGPAASEVTSKASASVGGGAGVAPEVSERAGTLQLDGPGGLPVQVADDDSGRAQVLAVLEDRSRLATLERCLAEQTSRECPLEYRWFRTDTGEELPSTGAVLDAGERIHIELSFQGKAPLPWFVAVVLVDPIGRLRLLSTRMPEGIELGPGHRESIGVRTGRARAGIELPWPPGAGPGAGAARLLLLASRRPVALEHLVPAVALDDDMSLVFGDPPGDVLRARRPEHARACAWRWFEFTLRTTPAR